MNTIHTVSIPLESVLHSVYGMAEWRFHPHPFDWLRAGSSLHRLRGKELIAIVLARRLPVRSVPACNFMYNVERYTQEDEMRQRNYGRDLELTFRMGITMVMLAVVYVFFLGLLMIGRH